MNEQDENTTVPFILSYVGPLMTLGWFQQRPNSGNGAAERIFRVRSAIGEPRLRGKDRRVIEESFDRCHRRHRVLDGVSLSVEVCASSNGEIPPEIDAALWKIERGARFHFTFQIPTKQVAYQFGEIRRTIWRGIS